MSHPSRPRLAPTAQQRLRPSSPTKRRRSPLMLLVLVVLWSLIMGLGLAQATEKPIAPIQIAQSGPRVSDLAPETPPIGTVDEVPRKYQLGQELYLDNCATCHIGVPPAVLPTETWRQLLQDSQHYGTRVKPLVDPPRLLVWDYLRNYSRVQINEEKTPYRIADSRFFKALHPRVEFSQPIKLNNCATCHLGASQFNFRQLAPEWENSP